MQNLKLIMIITTLLCSCTKEIPIKLNEAAEHLNKPVISALFSLEANDTVFLDYTYGLYNAENIKNTIPTEIEIATNTESLGFLNNIQNKYFTIPNNVKLSNNKNYNLNVSLKDKETLKATFEIPAKPKVTAESAFTQFLPSPSGNSTQIFTFDFQDDENSKNFYEMVLFDITYNEFTDTSVIWIMRSVSIPDLVLDNEGDLPNRPITFVFSDELFNGQTYNFRMTMEASVGSPRKIKGKFMDGKGCYLVFRAISEDYYLFKKSLSKHWANQVIIPYAISDIDLDIIFPGEPSELYTNVKGGYGIVAGYQEVIIPFIEK